MQVHEAHALGFLVVIQVSEVSGLVVSHLTTADLRKFALVCRTTHYKFQAAGKLAIHNAVKNTFDLSDPRFFLRALRICCEQCPRVYPWDVVEFMAKELDKHKLFCCPVQESECKYAFLSYEDMVGHLESVHPEYDTCDIPIDSAAMQEGRLRPSKLYSSHVMDSVDCIWDPDKTSNLSKMKVLLMPPHPFDTPSGTMYKSSYLLDGPSPSDSYAFASAASPAIFGGTAKVFDSVQLMCDLCAAEHPTMKQCNICKTWLPGILFVPLEFLRHIRDMDSSDEHWILVFESIRALRALDTFKFEELTHNCRYCIYEQEERHELFKELCEILKLHETIHAEELSQFPDYSTNYAYLLGDTAYTFEGKPIGQRDPNYDWKCMKTDKDPSPMEHTVVVTPAGKRHVLMDDFLILMDEEDMKIAQEDAFHCQYPMYDHDTSQTDRNVVECARHRAAYQSRLDNAGCQ